MFVIGVEDVVLYERFVFIKGFLYKESLLCLFGFYICVGGGGE